MARSLSVRGSARKLALTGAALATAGGTLTIVTVAAPSALAASCSGSGTSSTLRETGNGVEPSGSTFPTGTCGGTIELTKASSDSYMGLLYDTNTGKWVYCDNGKFQKWTGGTLTLCTGVLAGTTFAVAQESSTEHSITVVVN